MYFSTVDNELSPQAELHVVAMAPSD